MLKYGYYFYETSHNSYKLGIISEYIHRNLNLEVVYRIREKQHLYWSEDKLLKIAYNHIIVNTNYLEKNEIILYNMCILKEGKYERSIY